MHICNFTFLNFSALFKGMCCFLKNSELTREITVSSPLLSSLQKIWARKKIGRGGRGRRVKIVLGANFFAWARKARQIFWARRRVDFFWARKARKKLLGAEGAEGA